MNPRRLPQLRLHEWAFGLFLIVTAARLGVAGAWLPALAFGGMAAAVPAMAAIAARWPGPASARVRLLLLPVWVNLAYFRLGEAVTCLKLDSYDAALLRMDQFWLGATPAAWLGAWSHPVLTEFLSACYLLFFPAVLAAFVIVMIHPETVGVKLFNGLITIYAVGFLGYTLVPAAGPYLAMVALPPPPAGYCLTQINADLVAGGSNRVDVFPSLHVAITVFLMGTLWQRRRRLFFALLIPAAGLCGATLYLRFHYAVDLAAGLVLAGGGLWLAARSLPSDEPHR